MSHDAETAYSKAIYKRVRELTGATSADALSEKLKVGRTTVFEWQRGERPIPQKYLARLAREYGKTLDWFYRDLTNDSGEEPKNSSPMVFDERVEYRAAVDLDPDDECTRVLKFALAFRQLPIERQLELSRQVDSELRSQLPASPAPGNVITAGGIHKSSLPAFQQRSRRSSERGATEEDIKKAVKKSRRK